MENNVKQNNPMAIASLVLGIVSCVFAFLYVWVGLVCGVVAIILAVKGRKIVTQKGLATAGLVLGIIGTALSGLFVACALCALATLGSFVSQFS